MIKTFLQILAERQSKLKTAANPMLASDKADLVLTSQKPKTFLEQMSVGNPQADLAYWNKATVPQSKPKTFLSILGENVKQGLSPLTANVKQGIIGMRAISKQIFELPSVKEEKRLKKILTEPSYLISPETQKKGFIPPKPKKEEYISIPDKPEFAFAPKEILKSQIDLLPQYMAVAKQAAEDKAEQLAMQAAFMTTGLVQSKKAALQKALGEFKTEITPQIGKNALPEITAGTKLKNLTESYVKAGGNLTGIKTINQLVNKSEMLLSSIEGTAKELAFDKYTIRHTIDDIANNAKRTGELGIAQKISQIKITEPITAMEQLTAKLNAPFVNASQAVKAKAAQLIAGRVAELESRVKNINEPDYAPSFEEVKPEAQQPVKWWENEPSKNVPTVELTRPIVMSPEDAVNLMRGKPKQEIKSYIMPITRQEADALGDFSGIENIVKGKKGERPIEHPFAVFSYDIKGAKQTGLEGWFLRIGRPKDIEETYLYPGKKISLTEKQQYEKQKQLYETILSDYSARVKGTIPQEVKKIQEQIYPITREDLLFVAEKPALPKEQAMPKELEPLVWAKGTRAAGIQMAGLKNYNKATKMLENVGELPKNIKTEKVTKDFIRDYYETKKPPIAGDTFTNAKGEVVEITKVKDNAVDYFLKGEKKGIAGTVYSDKGFKTKSQLTALPTEKADAIPADLQKSIAEAKAKGLSAEEFVEAQPKFYHGTLTEGAKEIEKTGFKFRREMGKTTPFFDDAYFGDVIYLTNNKQQAQRLAEQMGTNRGITTFKGANTEVLEIPLVNFRLANMPKGATNAKQFKAKVEKLKLKGFDGILEKAKSENWAIIWNKDKLKTKSQLTDLYNQAVKEKPALPQAEDFVNWTDDKGRKFLGLTKIKNLTDEGAKSLQDNYEAQKDLWFKNKDKRVLQSKIEQRQLQTKIKQALGIKKYNQQARDTDQAIQIYIDSKRNPEHITQFYKDLTAEQQKIVDLSQELTPAIKKIADKIQKSYEQTGLEALSADIIKNVLDNYAARIWDLEGNKKTFGPLRKFGTTTRHAKLRVFETIIEGMAKGYELKVKSATNNLQILKEEIVKTIADKQFIKALQKIKTVDGNPLITTKRLEGYIQIEHPNFNVWEFAGQAKEGKVYGKNFLITDDGTLLERRSLYAPKAQAENLNNILGISKLSNVPGVKTLTKYNAIIKSWILQTSLFHHFAFMRSYYLGTNHKTFSEMNVRTAYREGVKAIEQENPILMQGVENGLTLGLKQDWEESLVREKTLIGKILDKNKASKFIKDKIMALRQSQADFLFGEFGAGLKAKAFLIEFRHQTKKYPNENTDIIAKRVANLINDDFGGLHLQRMGRNPTLQHIFRIFALAPDWTESNIRTMVKMVAGGTKTERRMYRRFWAGVLVKGVLLTVLANLLLNRDEFEENYKRAWKEGGLKWLDIDITNIYKALGGKSVNRKYFSILGHFKDPLKFITHPIKSAKHKGSVVFGFFHDMLSGVDWAGRGFTDADTLFKEGKTVEWGWEKGPISYSQLPSFMSNQLRGFQPVQIQNLLSWIAGEMEAFDAIANSLGLGVRTTYEPKSSAPNISPALQRLIDKYEIKTKKTVSPALQKLIDKYEK